MSLSLSLLRDDRNLQSQSEDAGFDLSAVMSPQGVTPQKYFPRITASHIEGNAHSVRFRQHQFHKLHSVLVSSKPQLVKALIADNGYTDPEAEYEFSLTLSDLRKMYESVDFEDELASSLAVQRGQDSLLRKRGLGIVYIRPERSKSSLYAVLSPLCAALAAGNCIIVEASIPRFPRPFEQLAGGMKCSTCKAAK